MQDATNSNIAPQIIQEQPEMRTIIHDPQVEQTRTQNITIIERQEITRNIITPVIHQHEIHIIRQQPR